MDNFYRDILNLDTEEALKHFLIHDTTDNSDETELSKEDLQSAARLMITLFEKTDTEALIKIIKENKDSLFEVNTKNIPQYGNLDNVMKMPLIVKTNEGGAYEDFGYFFNKDANDLARKKFGENHYKVNALCGITTWKKPYRLTAFGQAFTDLDEDKQKALMSKLYLRIPIIQRFILDDECEEIHPVAYLKQYLSNSTVIRRLANCKHIFNKIYETVENGNEVIKKAVWNE